MIKKRTVFVLGAGANVPYGFSTGEGLLVKARELTVDSMAEKTSGQLQRRQLIPLANALTDNFLPSIDALLERREDLRPAGKKLMLSLLLDHHWNVRLDFAGNGLGGQLKICAGRHAQQHAP